MLWMAGNTHQQIEEFRDPRLGVLQLRRELGCVGTVVIEGSRVEVILGSDGEAPSEVALQTIVELIDSWSGFRQEIIGFAKSQFDTDDWHDEVDLPDPESWALMSIQVLWRDDPQFAMLYFTVDNDERSWFVTVREWRPVEVSYDH
jgi:hypothetical protein